MEAVDVTCPTCGHQFAITPQPPDGRGPIRPFGHGAVIACRFCLAVIKANDNLVFEEVLDTAFIESPPVQAMIAAAAPQELPIPEEPEPEPDPPLEFVEFDSREAGPAVVVNIDGLELVMAHPEPDIARTVFDMLRPVIPLIRERVIDPDRTRFVLEPGGYEWAVTTWQEDVWEVVFQDIYGQWPWEQIPPRPTLEDWRVWQITLEDDGEPVLIEYDPDDLPLKAPDMDVSRLFED